MVCGGNEEKKGGKLKMKNEQEGLRQISNFAYPSFNLSEQELRVAGLVLRGYTYTGIADALNIRPNTVKTHQKNIYFKLDINTKRELFAIFEE